MLLNYLKICNVRNHKNSLYKLDTENIFIGENGSGKTTILESIYLLFAMRGFKKQAISDIVSFNEKYMAIETEYSNNVSSFSIVLKFDGNKTLLVDNTAVDKISDFLYEYPIACYTPDMLGVLSPLQADRRNFIDRYIFYADKSYIEDLKLYNRFLAQKISLFEKEFIDETYLNILNEKIIHLSKIISEKRINFLEKINLNLKEIYSFCGFPSDDVYLSYKTNINNFDLINKEKENRCSYYGIQKDKIDMCKDEKITEKFSSIGQKKTFLLLCLYSALKIIEKKRKTSIMVLLDDFEATLDKKRAEFLKTIFSDNRQTIFTGVENLRLNFKNTINL